MMFEFLKWKCLDMPRPIGAALGLLVIFIGLTVQLAFLSVQLVQGIVFALMMPMAPLAMSWVVNHLYATPMGKVHVWAFRLYQRCAGLGQHHSQGTRTDLTSTHGTPYAVHTIACLLDNYCYLLVDQSGELPYPCCVIDASDADAVLAALREIAVTQYGGSGIGADGKDGDDDDAAAERLSWGAANVAERGAGCSQNSGHDQGEAARLMAEEVAALLASLKGMEVSEGLPVATLRDLVRRAGLSDAGCTEKAELVLRAQDAKAKLLVDMQQHQQEQQQQLQDQQQKLQHKLQQRRDAREEGLVDGFSDVLRLDCVLSTHKHWDHTCGNERLLKEVKPCKRVYGGRLDRVPACTHPLDDGDVVGVGNLQIVALHTPCHTRGSLCFQVKGQQQSGSRLRGGGGVGTDDAMFTGDTLFCGGCGAPFEGDVPSMSRAFQRIWLEATSERALLFPGHDYAETLMPQYFNGGQQFPLPSHPNDYKTLTDRYWSALRFRRSSNPPLPAVPVSLQVEMAFNAYFNPLHGAADTVAAALRRMALVYFEANRDRLERKGNNKNNNKKKPVIGSARGASQGDFLIDDSDDDADVVVEGKKRRIYLTVPVGAVEGQTLEFDTGDGRTAAMVVPPGSKVGDRIPVNIPVAAPTRSSSSSSSSSSSRKSSSSSSLRNPSLKPGMRKQQSLGSSGGGGSGSSGGNSNSSNRVSPHGDPFNPTSSGNNEAGGGHSGSDGNHSGSTWIDDGGAPASTLGDENKDGEGDIGTLEGRDSSGDDGEDQEGLDFAAIGDGGDNDGGGGTRWAAAAFNATDYGAAYGVTVTMATLVSSLQTLCAGKDRVDLKTLFRALTTLGSRRGTGANSTTADVRNRNRNCRRPRRGRRARRQSESSGGETGSDEEGDEGEEEGGEGGGREEEEEGVTWRGMTEDEALELIDCINLPQQVLSTSYRDYPTSEETLVVEYLASILAAACDSEPRKVQTNGFLGALRKCCSCCGCPPTRKQAGSTRAPSSSSPSPRFAGARKGLESQKVRGDSCDPVDDESDVPPEGFVSEGMGEDEGSGVYSQPGVELTAP